MPEFTIEWVGDSPHEFKGTNSWAVAGKDGAGNPFKKTKLERPASSPPPQRGESINGTLEPHPRMDGVQLLVEGGFAAPSPAQQGSVELGPDPRKESIDRAVAFKGAVELVAAHGHLQDRSNTESVADLTEALLPIVRGDSGNGEQPPDGNAETEQGDGDIPF